ncbi:hypothetical protein [Noviherbaspirillum galbum]|uniref:Lipoprotein n=1 Tax=Noviherbaspirillum galbum TaxID=2709383 RepID=A0A6B3SYN6_9BURK|nr:hypothetical protein [Noviherbaspirillum galbum]NEX63179.1 hypothetical protein [Noviherbaspirillum galbum]
MKTIIIIASAFLMAACAGTGGRTSSGSNMGYGASSSGSEAGTSMSGNYYGNRHDMAGDPYFGG